MGSRARPRGRRLLGGPRPRRARLFRGERGVGALLVLGLLALSVSALTSYTLPRLVEWRHNIGCVPGSDDGVACAPEMRHPDVDVVSVAVKPTCVTRVAVAALNQFVGPRRIHFVTADEARCEVLRGMASNVECHPEDRVVPGITKRAVAAELQRLHGLDADARYVGRETSGWYLQQLVKLGAAAHVPNLSQTFLVWDPDMIALWPIKLFGARQGATGELRALRHVGGYVIPSYEPSYRALTGDAMRRAPDGSSYVTHQMTMRREYVQEMLDAFANAWDTTLKAASERTAEETAAKTDAKAAAAGTSGGFGDGKATRRLTRAFGILRAREAFDGGDGGGGGGGGDASTSNDDASASDASASDASASMPTWARAVLASVPRDALDLGFSEYASYASWVAAHHPETVEVVPTRVWSRHPLGPVLGSAAIRAFRAMRGDGLCCPTTRAVKAMKLTGYAYAGFEVGHVESCGLHAPEHAKGYGV